MKNTVLKFKKEKIGKRRVSDYLSRNIRMDNIGERFPEIGKLLKTGIIDDNSTLESLTNYLYSNPNLWDFIMLLNNRDPLFDLPYDYDTIVALSNSKYEKFLEQHPRVSITEERKEEMIQTFIDEISKENEKNRDITAVDAGNLTKVITILRQEGVL